MRYSGWILKAVIFGLALAAPAGNSTVWGSITFDVAGLSQTGVTGQVSFAYTSISDSAARLNITIDNTSLVGTQITGFAFNVPTLDGVSFQSIGGQVPGDIRARGHVQNETSVDGSAAQRPVAYQKGKSDRIKTPTHAGVFDIAIATARPDRGYIGSAAGGRSRIAGSGSFGDTTSLSLNIVGTGLQSLSNAAFEQAFVSEASSNKGFHAFGVRFQAVGANGFSDFAVPMSSTSPVPIPGAVVLGAVGLGIVGLVMRKRVR